MDLITSDSYNFKLDLRDLPCPLPLLKTKLCLKGLLSGHVLYVVTTGGSSFRDFSIYLGTVGYTLQTYKCVDSVHHFLIKK